MIKVGNCYFLPSNMPSYEDISTSAGSFEITSPPLPFSSHACNGSHSHKELSLRTHMAGPRVGPMSAFPEIFGFGEEGLVPPPWRNVWNVWELSFAIYHTCWTWEMEQRWEWRAPSLKREKKNRQIRFRKRNTDYWTKILVLFKCLVVISPEVQPHFDLMQS